MLKFRKICAIIGLITSIIATFLGCRTIYLFCLDSTSDALAVSMILAYVLGFLSYILAGGVMNTISSAFSLVKWGFLFCWDIPGMGIILGPIFGLLLAGVALMFLPMFPVMFVYRSIQQKGLLSI